jgi:hypothetical protein
MKILREIYHLWYKNVQLMNTILMVIIISQLISYFDIKLISNTIIPVAYLVSVFFLIRTFNETRNRTKMEIGKEISENYSARIQAVISKFKKKNDEEKKPFYLLNSPEVEDTTGMIPASYKIINLVISFISGLEKYKYFIDRMNNRDAFLFSVKNEDLVQLISYYADVQVILKLNFDFCGECVSIYDNINRDKEFMSEEQVKLLYREIDFHTQSYSQICRDIKNKKGIFNIYNLNCDFADLEGKPLVMEGAVSFSKLYSDDFTKYFESINRHK